MARETTQLDLALATPSSAESAMPPAPRLRLAPGRAGRGVMDGGWWPRSRNTTAELTELVAALTEPGNTVTRVNIDFDDWDAIPLRIIVRGREVRVGWLAHREHMVAVTTGRADPILLLVIPPGAAPSSAEAALARSVVETGVAMPQEILASCDISTRRG
ncbi:DUF5994 family protein [Actinomadura welshii]|uniref:DUF5994 family protein n=1 Tax=Actinomadura welshii TaxID=3103817 RepID=UPI0003AD09A6|nr:DUF5994 family protein [Actinomadura madurae]